MPGPPLYELRRVVRRYGSHLALTVERLSIEEGSIVGVAGPNGSGKSTLLKILAFLEAATEGEFFYEGQRVEMRDPALRRQATLLLQDPYLLRRSVFENVAYGLRVRGETAGLRDRVHRALTRVGLDPKAFAHRRWNALSGGEAQRVALASRLALRPKVLLLDEPLASVDAASAALITEAALRVRQEWGATLVLVSHDLAWLNAVSDTVWTLFRGRMAGQGTRNVLPGPWPAGERPGERFKRLDDGQVLLATQAPAGVDANAAAVFDPSEAAVDADAGLADPAVSAPAGGPEMNRLRGILTQMIYEKNRRTVLLYVQVGGLSLACRMTEDDLRTRVLLPGQVVRLTFPADRFEWM
jgi:tungstate transport system ATP-binding protein